MGKGILILSTYITFSIIYNLPYAFPNVVSLPSSSNNYNCEGFYRIINQMFTTDELREYRFYVFPKTVGEGYGVKELYGEPIVSPDSESWLFFIDEVPTANWGHRCRIVFIMMDDYDIVQYDCLFPPDNLDEFIDITQIVRSSQ